MRDSRVTRVALRLLRYVLPMCLIAASAIAAVGLFRDVGRTDSQPASDQAPSLSLGSSGASSPATVTAPVSVLDVSGVTSLAARTAADLRSRGIDASVGTLSTPLTTAAGTAVYYSPGIQSQAQALAQLSGAATISPAPVGLGSAGTLVLVLNDPGSAAGSTVATGLTTRAQ